MLSSTQSTEEIMDTQPLTSQESDIKMIDDKVVWGWLVSMKPRNNESFLQGLAGDQFSVGRDSECSCQLDREIFKGVDRENLQFSKLSRVQFVVFNLGDRASILDKSMNGVFVNTRKVGRDKSLSLMHGDIISIVQKDFEVFCFLMESKITSSYPIEISSKYLVGRALGEGSTAVVREGFTRGNMGQVAMKFVKKSVGETTNLMQEVDILRNLEHPCITNVVDVVETENMFVIIMEFVGGGELFDQVVKEHGQNYLDEDKAKFQFYQIAHTLAYLHNNRVCHRDLKLENILLNHKGPNSLIKVTDFGLSKMWSSTKHLQTYAGTPVYMAPEIVKKQISFENSVYTYKSDCWSLGVVLFVMLSGHMPFDGNCSSWSLVQQIVSGNHYPMTGPRWEKVSLTARSLVKQLLETDPVLRPSAQQVLRHPWLQGEVIVRARGVMGLAEEGKPPEGEGLKGQLKGEEGVQGVASAQQVLRHPWLQGEVVLRARGVMGLAEDVKPPEGERLKGQLKGEEEGVQGAKSAQQVPRHPWLQGEVVLRARGVMGLAEDGKLPEGEGLKGHLKGGVQGVAKKRKVQEVEIIYKRQGKSGLLRRIK